MISTPGPPPTISYERMGEVRANCTVCGQTRAIPRFRMTRDHAVSYVVAPMCPHCDNRFTHGLLPFHPWWFRTPQDVVKSGVNR